MPSMNARSARVKRPVPAPSTSRPTLDESRADLVSVLDARAEQEEPAPDIGEGLIVAIERATSRRMRSGAEIALSGLLEDLDGILYATRRTTTASELVDEEPDTTAYARAWDDMAGAVEKADAVCFVLSDLAGYLNADEEQRRRISALAFVASDLLVAARKAVDAMLDARAVRS